MAEDQDKSRTSRRAERRAEREAEGAEDRDEAAEGEGEVDAEAAPAAMNRRQRRAAKATGSSPSDDPRDRADRLRDASRQRRIERSKERQAAVARGLDPSERVDDALSRSTQAVTGFIRKHFNVVQWLIVLGILGGVGYQVYAWRHGKSVEQASDELMAAVSADTGRVGEPLTGDQAEFERAQTFPTDQARTKAAAQAYQKVAAARGDAPLGTLAKLGLAGVRYDEAKYAEAATLYREVAASKLATKDSDVKYRAIEGTGLALESKGDGEAALKAYKELANSAAPGFAALGIYHQARMALAKGDKTATKQLLETAKKKLGKPGDPEAEPHTYLRGALQEIEVAIDPAAAASASSFAPGQLETLQKTIGSNPAKLNELLEQMGLDPNNLPGGDGPAAPTPPAAPMPPAPLAPAPEPAPGTDPAP